MKHSRKELLLVAGLVGVLVWIGGQIGYQFGTMVGARSATIATSQRLEPFLQEKRTEEIQPLADAYGPSHNSEHAEEWIVRDYFKDERGGVFVEVGASHYQQLSNTYFLEKALGWSGAAVEPQVKFAADYKRYRPRTTFVPLFVSNVSNQETTLYVTRSDTVASGVREFTESFGEVTPTRATTSTLDDILDRLGMQRIDFLSIDIELGEPQALAGFSIGRFSPRLVVIEAHQQVRQQILDYFARNNYVMVGRYWQVDDENLWFAPLGQAREDEPRSALAAPGDSARPPAAPVTR